MKQRASLRSDIRLWKLTLAGTCSRYAMAWPGGDFFFFFFFFSQPAWKERDIRHWHNEIEARVAPSPASRDFAESFSRKLCRDFSRDTCPWLLSRHSGFIIGQQETRSHATSFTDAYFCLSLSLFPCLNFPAQTCYSAARDAWEITGASLTRWTIFFFFNLQHTVELL